MNKNEKKWSCSMCTFDNYQASSKCSICLHPRGSEVIQFPPVTREKPLVIHDVESESTNNSFSDFIICPPSCSSKSAGKNLTVAASNQFNEANTAITQYQDEANNFSLISNKSWSCSVCYFSNPEYNAFCTQCNSHKDKNTQAKLEECQNACFSKDNANISGKWLCGICTYENWNASRKCVMCHNEKGATHNCIIEEKQLKKNKNENVNAATSSKTSLDQFIVDSKSNLTKLKGLQDLDNNLTSYNTENLTRSIDITLSQDAYCNKHKSPSSSVSSGSSYSSDDTKAPTSTQHRNNRQRKKKVNQVSSNSLRGLEICNLF